MDIGLGIFEDEQPLASLAGVDRGATSLWLDGHARDFAALREFVALEVLSIYRLPRRNLSLLAACALPRVSAMTIRHADAEDLTFLEGYSTVETLTVWQSPKLKRLDGIQRVTRLTALALSDLGPIDSLAPLSALRQLRSLALTGGVWKTQGLPSLAPLAGLTALEQLSLAASKVVDGDLGPLCDLRQLTRLDLSPRNFEPQELARVAAAHPWWGRELLELGDFDEWAGAAGCKTCGTHRKILFLRRKKLLWCPNCEGAKLASLLDEFEVIVEEAVRRRRQTARSLPPSGRLHPN